MFPFNNCRICEKQSNLIDISINPNYIEQYLIIGNVSYDANDGLPQFFCRFCITQLLHFVKFKQKCNETYSKFQDILMQTDFKTELNNHDDQDKWNYQDEDISQYSEFTKTETPNLLTLNANDDLLTVLSYEIDQDKVSSADSEDKEINSNNLRRLNTKDNLQFMCDICETKIFENMPNLESHMRKIHRMKANLRQCKQCGNISKWFSHNQLVRHNKQHTDEKPYQCECCDKRFFNKHHLVEHKRIHTGEKPYKCDICNKCFSRKGGLVKHTRIHYGEKPFKCDYCNKYFSQKHHLIPHAAIHTGEKPYKCDYCEKSFPLRISLVCHVRKHTGEKPYKCDYCENSFSLKASLISHVRKHTGEKPYKCEYCDKTLKHKSTLKDHIRIHTGEMPYKCEFCDKCFSAKSNLFTHAKVHAAIKPHVKEKLNYHDDRDN